MKYILWSCAAAGLKRKLSKFVPAAKIERPRPWLLSRPGGVPPTVLRPRAVESR